MPTHYDDSSKFYDSLDFWRCYGNPHAMPQTLEGQLAHSLRYETPSYTTPPPPANDNTPVYYGGGNDYTLPSVYEDVKPDKPSGGRRFVKAIVWGAGAVLGLAALL